MRNSILFIALFLAALIHAGNASAEDLPQAEVMMIGVFHFSNPGRDAVKSEVIDVLTADNQAYLDALTDRIAAFEPTAVLLEYDRAKDDTINGRYQQYRAREYELGVNEVDQLGFRIADKSGLSSVHSFDEREVHWDAGPLMERMETLPARKTAFDELIAEVGKQMTHMHQTLGLSEILIRFNQEKADRDNKGLYLMTNDVGAGAGFEGAAASASWWHRNFRMYALIQKHAIPGSRVVVIGGQGHTAILRDFLADDPDRIAVDLSGLF